MISVNRHGVYYCKGSKLNCLKGLIKLFEKIEMGDNPLEKTDD